MQSDDNLKTEKVAFAEYRFPCCDTRVRYVCDEVPRHCVRCGVVTPKGWNMYATVLDTQATLKYHDMIDSGVWLLRKDDDND